MKAYDPGVAVEPQAWLAVDESLRISLVEKFHRLSREHAGNPKMHAIIHVVVENQLALPDGEVARATLKRLLGEGVPRHGAIHAIGSVVAAQMFDIMKGGENGKVFNSAEYASALSKLEAWQWR